MQKINLSDISGAAKVHVQFTDEGQEIVIGDVLTLSVPEDLSLEIARKLAEVWLSTNIAEPSEESCLAFWDHLRDAAGTGATAIDRADAMTRLIGRPLTDTEKDSLGKVPSDLVTPTPIADRMLGMLGITTGGGIS